MRRSSAGVAEALNRAKNGKNPLAEVIREYFMVCHRMNDHILLIYQETQSLPDKWRRVVLGKRNQDYRHFYRCAGPAYGVGGSAPHFRPATGPGGP